MSKTWSFLSRYEFVRINKWEALDDDGTNKKKNNEVGLMMRIKWHHHIDVWKRYYGSLVADSVRIDLVRITGWNECANGRGILNYWDLIRLRD